MPEDVVTRLSREIAKGLESPELRDRLEKLGARPVGSSPRQLAAHVRSELDRWTRVVRTAGIQNE
jgi:tripartite-type tricarboxylate transporter receptor subunit TctC